MNSEEHQPVNLLHRQAVLHQAAERLPAVALHPQVLHHPAHLDQSVQKELPAQQTALKQVVAVL